MINIQAKQSDILDTQDFKWGEELEKQIHSNVQRLKLHKSHTTKTLDPGHFLLFTTPTYKEDVQHVVMLNLKMRKGKKLEVIPKDGEILLSLR